MGEFYLNLIKASRVSLVSTSGCDGERTDEFANTDFVTSCFYESAAMYCHMIGRYTKNEEIHRVGIEYVFLYVVDYNEFVKFMNNNRHIAKIKQVEDCRNIFEKTFAFSRK